MDGETAERCRLSHGQLVTSDQIRGLLDGDSATFLRLAAEADAGGSGVTRPESPTFSDVHRSSGNVNFAALDAEARDLLLAYAAGVNAFLHSDPVLPVEFQMLRVRPEPWTPVDSIVWVKMMAWDLGGNWRNELLRMRLAKTLPLARIQEFLPPFPGDAPLPIAELKAFYGELEREAIRLAGGGSGALLPTLLPTLLPNMADLLAAAR